MQQTEVVATEPYPTLKKLNEVIADLRDPEKMPRSNECPSEVMFSNFCNFFDRDFSIYQKETLCNVQINQPTLDHWPTGWVAIFPLIKRRSSFNFYPDDYRVY